MKKHSIVSVAEIDMLAARNSEALKEDNKRGSYFYLGRGKIWGVTKREVISIFGANHNERYFYKVRQNKLKAFNRMLFRHLRKDVFIYASTLRGECLELENKGLMVAVTREMARQNENEAGEMQYIH